MQRLANIIVFLGLASVVACSPIAVSNTDTDPQSTKYLYSALTQVAATLEASPNSPESTVIPEAAVESREVIEPANANQLASSLVIQDINAYEVEFLSTGNILVILGSEGLESIDLMQEGLTPFTVDVLSKPIAGSHLSLLNISRTNDTMAWVSDERTIHIISSQIDTSTRELTYSESPITGMAVSGDGGELIFSTYNGTVSMWDLNQNREKKTWITTALLTNLSYSPNSRYIGGVDLKEFAAHIYDLETGQPLNELEWLDTASPVLYGAYFSPDWETIAWVARGTVQLMDIATGNLGPILNHEDFINTVAWSPDGRLLAVASAASIDKDLVPVILLWDVSDGNLVSTLPQIAPVSSFDFSLDGTSLAVLTSNKEMRVWSVGQ